MTAVWTVTSLTRHIGRLFDGDEALSDVTVSGEISNFKHHSSGHMYFTLKDEESVIKCAMFRSANSRLRFRPEDGLRVIVHGTVSVYGPGGTYQLYPDRMEPDGLGSLYLAFEQRKAKLAKEGLFRPEDKRPLPFLPRRIGVVTSPTGAVLRDIRNVLFRRFPTATLVLSPAPVQGADAPAQLVRALERVAMAEAVDVVILARGGGSLEDLWPFNDEALARAIRQCPVPVVSAVGHETDFTIADFAADLRAPTPSAAAELVVPDLEGIRAQLAQASSRVRHAFRRRLDLERVRLDRLAARPVFRSPTVMLDLRRQKLDLLAQRMQHAASARLDQSGACLGSLSQRLDRAMRQRLDQAATRVAVLAGKLDALSPLRVLGRGYATVSREDGRTVSAMTALACGERIRVRFHDGSLDARVENLYPLEGAE